MKKIRLGFAYLSFICCFGLRNGYLIWKFYCFTKGFANVFFLISYLFSFWLQEIICGQLAVLVFLLAHDS